MNISGKDTGGGENCKRVQDVFLAALRQLHTLREDSSFLGWLAMIG